jgi:metal-sulfur cluster biosynthetic enzyme
MSEAREREVMARLDRVTDPELDEPVTDLGFVDAIEVEGGDVHVRFRLPTYWCAANFAFLMADDMRREVAALPWVTRVRIELGDHMYAETINRGLLEGRSFHAAFGDEASGGLDEVRRTFLRKSFQRRQEHALQSLLQAGHSAEVLAGLSVRELRGIGSDAATGATVARYLERREVAGPFGDNDLAFIDLDGRKLMAASLGAYLRMLRNVAVNIEFNGALCRGLLAARFEEEQPDEQGPGLRHFVREAARIIR